LAKETFILVQLQHKEGGLYDKSMQNMINVCCIV